MQDDVGADVGDGVAVGAGVAAAATTYTNHRIKRILQRQSCSLIF